MNERPAYTAAVILHFMQKWAYFEQRWTGAFKKDWLKAARNYVRTLWREEYKGKS